MDTPSLYAETVALMRRNRLPINRICQELGFGRRWWDRVLDGSINDPGVKRIEKLHAYLVEKQQDAA